MPPNGRPYPRFIADAPREKQPQGRFAERLAAEFATVCQPFASEAGAPLDAESVRWFPERTWGGRVYVPVTAASADGGGEGESAEGHSEPGEGESAEGHSEPGEGESAEGHGEGTGARPVEYFGHVSFVRPGEDGEPTDLRATADFTDVTAEDNPDWQIDLNDDVIGAWHADGGRGGDVTLVWGLPLVRGAVAATAELDQEVIDQAAINDGRFTLLAVDAVHGFGDDDHYLEIHLWDRRVTELARESLYDDD